MRRRGLGVSITQNIASDFFSLKPASIPTSSTKNQRFTKHQIEPDERVSNSIYYNEKAQRISPNSTRQSVEADLDVNTLRDIHFAQEINAQPENELLLPEPADEQSLPPDTTISIEVYDNYDFEHDYDDTLPITDVRERVIHTIEANRATIIQGATGSGKTTQVPQFILDDYQQRRKYCNILVTQPRRIAAISVARRVCQERNWTIGRLVGYQVARDRQVCEDTRITYMTTGVLLQKLIKSKNLDEYTHIILDEVHERDQDIDFSMLVVRKFLRTVSRHVKVILMSATVDCELFSNYFSILINGRQECAPVISVDGKMYNVTEYYFEDLSFLSEPPSQNIYEPAITEKCYQLCCDLILRLDKDELGDNYREDQVAGMRGTVLCFLPGLPEITQMHKYLERYEVKKRYKIIPLHSQIASKDQVAVFYPAEKFQRKIILSTNIAESSITVPDIKYVIDFCLTKSNETDRETNYQRLTLQWASKASLTQRKGRAGRVSEGHCFRMISSSFYDQLYDYCTPEMLRAPLEQVVLKVKLLELGPPAFTLKLALQPPDITDIKRTILMLKEVGAVTVRQNDSINPLDGDLTFVGRVLGTLPVDVRIGKLLLIGYAFGVLEECLVIGACLSLKSIFSRRFGKELQAYTNKMYWSGSSGSDLLASFYAFLSWKYRKEHVGFGEQKRLWAERNHLEIRRFQEVDALIKDLNDRLKGFNVVTYRNIYESDELSKDNEFLIKLAISAAFYPSYFQSQDIDESEATKTMSGHSPFNTVVVYGAPPTLCYYRKSVATLFRTCGRGRTMYFENSRAFIEFENDSGGESIVAPAVYKAIKLRHLRIPLAIHVSKKKDEDFRSSLSSNPLESFNPETGLKTNRMNTTLDNHGKLSVTLQGNPRQVKLVESGYKNIVIQNVLTPGHFWATYGDQETQQKMYQLHQKLNIMGGRNLKQIEPENVRIGNFCLALYEDEFFRAEICQCNGKNVKVFFLDYGNIEVISNIRSIRECPESLLDIPFQAFECQLCEIRPIKGEWDQESKLRFNELVEPGACMLIAKIYSKIHGMYRLEIFRDDVSINRQLIEEGYATVCEETLVSKTRHETMGKLTESQTKPNSGLTLPDASEGQINERDVLKITLRGPFSPYETSFYSLTASGRMRSSRIEQDSVNSVVICEEPQEKHSRLLVAAAINMNNQGNSIIARETTYLPNIRGLTSLIPLLFAPVCEFRLNREKTAVTGFICGLGADDNGTSILPDHDIEIAFDVKVSEKVSGMANAIRFAINLAIGIQGDKIELSQQKMAAIQNHIKEKLLNLVNTEWQPLEPQNFRYDYQWNMLDPEITIDCGYTEEPYHLYAYHKGIFFAKKESEIDYRIIERRRTIKELHCLAGNSLVPFSSPVVCELCNVTCRHPRALYLHCETPHHKNWVDQLFKQR